MYAEQGMSYPTMSQKQKSENIQVKKKLSSKHKCFPNNTHKEKPDRFLSVRGYDRS